MTNLYRLGVVLAIGVVAVTLVAGCGQRDDQEQVMLSDTPAGELAALLAASPEELDELLADAPEVAVPAGIELSPGYAPPGTPGTGPGARQFVGQIAGTDIFVGLYVDENEVMAYVCDGIPEESPWTVKKWFVGTHDGRFDLLSGDAPQTSVGQLRLTGAIHNGQVEGILTLDDGQELAYAATLAGDGAGLLREMVTIDGETFAEGWITLPDGRIRGGPRSYNVSCICSGGRAWCRLCSGCSWYMTSTFC